MPRVSGFIEAYLITRGGLAAFASGNSLPANTYLIPVGITGNKDLENTPYNPPTDEYKNLLRSKRLYSFKAESLQNADWVDLNILHYMVSIDQGCELLVIAEGWTEYQGDGNGNPGLGSIWWRRNADMGIFFFTYATKSYMGLGFEYLLRDNSSSVQLNLEAALDEKNARDILGASAYNIVKRDSVPAPNLNSAKQAVLELKEVKYSNDGTTFTDATTFDLINSFEFAFRTVSNKRPRDSREIINLYEVEFTCRMANSSINELWQLWGINQFAAIKLIFAHPDGFDRNIIIYKNTLTNMTDFSGKRDAREGIFKIKGNVPRTRCYPDNITRTFHIGYVPA